MYVKSLPYPLWATMTILDLDLLKDLLSTGEQTNFQQHLGAFLMAIARALKLYKIRPAIEPLTLVLEASWLCLPPSNI